MGESNQAKTRGTSASGSAGGSPKAGHPWWALTSLLIGLSIIIIDGSIVNVLLPDMVQDIGLTQTDAQ